MDCLVRDAVKKIYLDSYLILAQDEQCIDSDSNVKHKP